MIYQQRLLRDALCCFLNERGLQVEWVGTTLAEARAQRPVDLLVSEFGLADGSALDGVLEIRQRTPGVAGLFLVHRAEELRCVDLGEEGTAYIPSWVGMHEFDQALSSLRAGRSYVHSDLALTLIKGPGRNLTPGEHRVLKLVSDGLSAEEASKVLRVSVNTTKTHLRGVYRKLKVRGQAQAVVEAFRLGLVAPPETSRLCRRQN